MASKAFNKYKDGEQLNLAVRSLRKEARGWFGERSEEDDADAKASAWYHVSYHPEYWGTYNVDLERPHFLSFALCVYDKLILIKQQKVNMRKRAAMLETLENRLRKLRMSEYNELLAICT